MFLVRKTSPRCSNQILSRVSKLEWTKSVALQDELVERKFGHVIELCEVNSQQLQESRASCNARSDELTQHVQEVSLQFATKIEAIDCKYERIATSQDRSLDDLKAHFAENIAHLDRKCADSTDAQNVRIQDVAASAKRQCSHIIELLETLDHKCGQENADKADRNQTISNYLAEQLHKSSETFSCKISDMENMVWHLARIASLLPSLIKSLSSSGDGSGQSTAATRRIIQCNKYKSRPKILRKCCCDCARTAKCSSSADGCNNKVGFKI